MNGKVLIVDDEPEVARSLILALERRAPNFKIIHSTSHEDAFVQFKNQKPEVAILDLTINVELGPESGLRLLDTLLELDPTTRFIILTGHAKNDKGLEALNRGAFTYLVKPSDPDVILAFINDGIEVANLKRANLISTSLNPQVSAALGIKTLSSKMKSVIEQIEFAIQTSQPVLITGETGTGKGVLARLIHKFSQRKNRSFVRYQPSFTNSDLVASELFGHKKGAFTGASEDRKGLLEEAHQGTLFIDEVDALPKETQVSLLETLQEKTFRKLGGGKEQQSNFRLISALNRDIKEVLDSGTIRLDFFHRIAHFKIELPPLRERTEDLHDLSQICLDRICEREDLDLAFIDDSAIYKLKQHTWPGNIRELQAVIEGSAFRASISGRKFISGHDIHIQKSDSPTDSLEFKSFRERIKAYEAQIVYTALKEAKGNKAQAAKNLQMDRTVFCRILERIPRT